MVNRAVLTLLLSLLGCKAHAAIYYVAATGGDNARSCATSMVVATPRQTINSGLGCLSAGDTLLVRTGTYDEGITSVTSGTSWANKVRIANYQGETVWMRPSSNATSAGGIGEIIWFDCNCHYIEFDGIGLDGSNVTGGVVWVSTNNGNDPHHIRFQNAEVIAGTIGGGAAMLIGAESSLSPPATGSNEVLNMTIHGGGLPGECGFACASYGVYLKGPNNLVAGNNIYDTSGAAIQIYNGVATDASNNNIVRNNRMHGITRTGSPNEVWGVVVVGSSNQIYNNLIYDINVGAVNTCNAGIAVGNGVSGNKLWNNTIFNIRNSGICIQAGATTTEVRNNIVYQSSVTNYVNNAGGSTTHTNNIDTGTDPLFVDSSTSNFQLQSGSPARNTGFTVSAVATDITGAIRPQEGTYDIGAYEYAASSPPSTPVTSSSSLNWFWRVHHF